MVRDGDLIVPVLPEIKEELTHLFPEARNRIYTVREMSKWSGYFFIEDFDAPPLNNKYWHFVEEDPQFVCQTLLAVESSLVRAFPNIIQELGIGSTSDEGACELKRIAIETVEKP